MRFVSLFGVLVCGNPSFWLSVAGRHAEFLHNSEYSDNFACGSKLSDNSAKNPEKLDLTFGEFRSIITLQGKEKRLLSR